MTGFIAIAWAVFAFAILTLLLSPYGLKADLVKRRIAEIDQSVKKVNILDEDLSKPLSERIFKPILKSFSSRLNKLFPGSQKRTNNAQSEKLKKQLRQAGMAISAGEYSFIRLMVIVGVMLLFGLLLIAARAGSTYALFGAFVGAYAGYTIMRFSLTSKIKKRRTAMERQLPDVLDLLSINVEAGLGFEQAMLHVIDHFEGPLIDELAVTYREMTMGRPRREALILFSQRCELDDIKTFTGAMVQAEQMGISIKNVLRTQAASMRMNRKNKVEEKAMKISVKILLPMVGFIFPVLLIVLMGPAAVKIISQFM